MKKVEKISIAGIAFSFDRDANTALKQYLDTLRDHYREDPDGDEIIADIEAHIAEMILEEQVYTRIVTGRLIDSVIARLGTPQEIEGDPAENDPAGGSKTAAEGGSEGSAKIARRFYRSSEGRIFGGVSSGIARYLDINVAWVRVFFLLPVLLSLVAWPIDGWYFHTFFHDFVSGWAWFFVVLYILLWFAVPMAKTARQRLEARGERITPASIRQDFQAGAHTPGSRKAASVTAEILTVLGRVALLFVKIVVGVVGFSFLIAIVAMIVVLAGILGNPVSLGDWVISLSEMTGMVILTPSLFVSLVFFCVMLPLLITSVALLSLLFNREVGRVFYSVAIGTWLVAMLFCIFVAIANAGWLREEFRRGVHEGNWSEWCDDYDDDRPGSAAADCDDADHHHHRVRIRVIEEGYSIVVDSPSGDKNPGGAGFKIVADSLSVVIGKTGSN